MKFSLFGYLHPDDDMFKIFQELPRIRTAQEYFLEAGSPDLSHINSAEDVFKPQGVLSGKLSIEEANSLRVKRGFFISSPAGSGLNLDTQLVLKFSELDPNTGMTLYDPHVLGVLSEDESSIIEIQGRDLNSELRDWIMSMDKEFKTILGFEVLRDSVNSEELSFRGPERV